MSIISFYSKLSQLGISVGKQNHFMNGELSVASTAKNNPDPNPSIMMNYQKRKLRKKSELLKKE